VYLIIIPNQYKIAMVWEVWNGTRYFKDRTEYAVTRLCRIRDNWRKMIQLGKKSGRGGQVDSVGG
jgi:hypothetical protein